MASRDVVDEIPTIRGIGRANPVRPHPKPLISLLESLAERLGGQAWLGLLLRRRKRHEQGDQKTVEGGLHAPNPSPVGPQREVFADVPKNRHVP
jgi:hypothetical protein